MPHDAFQREINYLRVSVIDHCNMRCVYCMPLQGLSFAPSAELLTAQEIETVVRAAVEVGFRKVRLTGGEPLLRRDIVEIVERLNRIDGLRDLAMTTNGALLPGLAPALAKAGLKRINVHLDTLDPERLKRVMRFGRFEQIRAGIEAAEAAGLGPIKLNTVVVREYNDHDVVDLARLTLERDWHVRFIELMPFGVGECAQVAVGNYVPNTETKRLIERELGALAPRPNANPSDEAANYTLPGARGVIGFISPVSAPYCGTCNRMRLTCDGKFHLCLLHDEEIDVKAVLRGGGGLAAVSDVLLRAVGSKPTGHNLHEGISTEKRSMFQLGG